MVQGIAAGALSPRLLLSAFIAVFAGLCHGASLALPWDGRPSGCLQLFALGALAWQLHRVQRPVHGAILGWLFCTAWLCATFWWMFVAMHTYAGLTAWMSCLAVGLLAAVLSLYYAIAAYTYVALRPKQALGAAALFASVWLLAELARGVWFTGFGWGAAGYAHIDGLAHFAKYVGAYGIAALVALIASLFAQWLQAPLVVRRGWMPLLGASIASVMAWAPASYSEGAGRLQVALLQGNIAQDQKFQPGTGVVDALRWYGEQLHKATAPLVVAPETAIPLLPQDLPEGYLASLESRYAHGSQATLFGIPLVDSAGGYTNSVVGIRPDGSEKSAYRYDKHHLVPFGEFIPPLFRWFTEMMNIPLGDFSRGVVGQASFEWRGQWLAPNICYEDLFGEELAQRFGDPAKAPTIFVNVSNIGWFGDTVAIDQHLNISRMRALEFERPFIRATNTGETAIIDYQGHVSQRLARFTRGILLGEVEGRRGLTPFAWWASSFGLWPLWLTASAIVLAAWIVRRGRSGRCP
ncbi:MAG: apolipoprotein N-acyltransferase [Burkholderiaceae bacterium]